jgi:1,4-dihydroxy-2-naphthoate octaprenyltransferase
LYFFLILPHRFIFLLLVGIGAFLGIFYTATPVGLKYNALGDIAVFLAFGPIMTLGAFFVQKPCFSWVPVLYSLPLAFLVDAVLHGNNLRDIKNDKAVNIKTVPILIGEARSKKIYYSLILLSYLSQIILIIFAKLPLLTLLTVLSIPFALKLINLVKDKEKIEESVFALIDMYTSQFHLIFGLLYLLGIIIDMFIR